MTKTTNKFRNQPCSWYPCKKIIKVDSRFDCPRLGMYVGGFCQFHSQVYNTRYNLIKAIDPTRHYSEIANEMYKNDRKRFDDFTKKAIAIVMESKA